MRDPVDEVPFFPTAEMRFSLASIYQRAEDGTLSVRLHLYRLPLLSSSPRAEEDRLCICMGGAWCLGKFAEFCCMYSYPCLT